MKTDWEKRIQNALPSFKARNPHLYKPVVRLRPQKPEPDVGSQDENSGVEARKERTGFRIVLTVFRKRALDKRDNAPFSLKALSDHITRGLGFDDDEDPRLEWEYHYIASEHARGTHVLIIQLDE